MPLIPLLLADNSTNTNRLSHLHCFRLYSIETLTPTYYISIFNILHTTYPIYYNHLFLAFPISGEIIFFTFTQIVRKWTQVFVQTSFWPHPLLNTSTGSRICPIYYKGNSSLLINYRSVSILLTLLILFEHIFY